MYYKKLLSEELESYYWAGFLIADGTHNCGIRIALSLKDIEHLQKLADYVDRKNPINTYNIKNSSHSFCYIDLGNKDFGLEYTKKFGWKKRKTYNPPEIDKIPIDKDKFLSWFIGFIDADGCIQYQTGRKDFKISIHLHSSWLEIIKHINNRLNELFDYTKIKQPSILKTGFLRYDIACIRTIKDLKNFSISKNLPMMERKWNKVDLNYLHKYEKREILYNNIVRLRKQGYSLKNTAMELGITYHNLTGCLYNSKYAKNRKTL
jgi:hypothetical protein